mmetsp:Transcript_11976/g.20807  ORF Transcript_11976/g.20807 Transcript_11976/m.20807 type:complete len:319 (+) Transcript_11976:93-1049(+)
MPSVDPESKHEEAKASSDHAKHPSAANGPLQVAVDKLVAEGGEAFVFEGTFNGSKVAIKQMRGRKWQKENNELGHQIDREIQIMRSLKHPGIVTLKGVLNEREDNPVIIMEFLEGGSLQTYLHKNRKLTTARDVVRIALDIAEAMLYLHQHHIIHRDLNSRNVLLDANGHAKVLDFSQSRLIPDEGDYMTRNLGSFRYAAPEVIRLENYSTSADVFSFGVLLWEIAHAETPYAGMKDYKAANAVATKSLRPPLTVTEVCPEELNLLMAKCWDDHPEKRPDFSAVVGALKELLPKLPEAKHDQHTPPKHKGLLHRLFHL